MDDRMLRTLRGLCAAVIALFVAALSHVAAGGGPPAGAGLALSAAFAAVVCTVLTRKRPSLFLLTLSVAVSQAVFHLLFAVGDGTGSGLEVAVVRHGPHTTTALVAAAGGGTTTHLHQGAAGALHGSGWMWAAHAVAAVITIALLRHGELTLRNLVAIGRTHVVGRGRSAAVVARPVLARAVASLAALVGLLAAEVRPPGRVPDPGGAHLGGGEPAALRDLGVAFARLRFRGPPALPAVRIAIRPATP